MNSFDHVFQNDGQIEDSKREVLGRLHKHFFHDKFLLLEKYYEELVSRTGYRDRQTYISLSSSKNLAQLLGWAQNTH